MSDIISDIGTGKMGPANEWLTGETGPGPSLGRVGQPFQNTATGDIYVKELVAGVPAWVLKGNLTGPQGEPGDQGLPGVNAVPTDEAVATYATTEGTALNTGLRVITEAATQGLAPAPYSEALDGPIVGAGYDTARNLFNPKAWHQRLTRAKLAAAKAGVSDLVILVEGDSNSHGLGAYFDLGDVVGANWPDRLGQLLAARGYPVAEGAFWPAAADGHDSRWVTSGSVGESNGLLASFDSGGYGTFTPIEDCTGFEVTYLNQWAGSFSFSVDGGANQTVTASGAGGYDRFTVTGLTLGPHTIRIIGSPGSAYIAYIEPMQASGRVRIQKAAVSGSKATEWADATGFNYADNALSTYPTVTVVMLGSNDLDSTPAVYATKIDTIVARARTQGSAVLVVGPPPRLENDFSAYYAELYPLAIAEDFPLLDLRERIGPFAPAKAAGYFTDEVGDTVHISAAGLPDIALAVGHALTIL